MPLKERWNNIDLFERQIKPAEILLGQRSLLLYHSPGSGKTFAALYAVYKLTQFESIPPNIIVVAPAKVITEVWRPNIEKLHMSNIFTLTSYELLRARLSSVLSSMEQNRKVGVKYIVIFDEVHVIRNIHTKSFHAAFAVASKGYKLLLLTGTPIVNSIRDTLAIARLLKNDARFTFLSTEFIDPSTLQIINMKRFINIFHGYVHSYQLELNPEDYPTITRLHQVVKMYPLQQLRYKDFISELLTPQLRSMMEEGIISNALNPFLVRTRAISNTIGKFKLEGEVDTYEQSEKFIGIRQAIIDDPKPSVIYSFFLSNGVVPMKQFLDTTTDLKTAIITGTTKNSDISRIIGEYNSGYIDVLFITSTVRQGITLLKTRALHIMEPSWNESMLEQIIGRVVRFHSHADLPPDEQNVKIYSWITHYGKITSTDEYIEDLSERKQKVISIFENALRD